jgi:proline dehydrogenase
MGLLHRAVVATLPLVPGPVMRRLSARYIAGETLAQAMTTTRAFANQGYGGVLDVLGEDVADEAEARGALAEYIACAKAIADTKVDSYVSVKPTHFGLRLSEDLCLELYGELATQCTALGQKLRVEMEDHTTTDATLRLFRNLRERFQDVGVVVQSRLFRTADDIAALPENSDVRLVKGIYLEPESMAHTDADAIRDAFVKDVERLFQAGHSIALATHDAGLADRAIQVAKDQGVGSERFEFEVLMGVQDPLWRTWRDSGCRVRVYVPFGPGWRAYSQRRLRKNPQVLGYVMRNFLG